MAYLIDCNYMYLIKCVNRVNGCKCKALSSHIYKDYCPFYKEKVNEKERPEKNQTNNQRKSSI